MAVHELFHTRETRDVRGGKGCAADLHFLVDGTTDEIAARNQLKTSLSVPQQYDGLPIQAYALKRLGVNFWQGTVNYAAREPKEEDFGQTNFDTTGGTQHISVSLEVTASGAVGGGAAPDIQDGGQGGAINSQPDGSVDGLDITVPQLSFQRTHIFAAGVVNDAWVKQLADMTGTTNDNTWYSFARGELLFLGASGHDRDDGTWEVVTGFAASPNQANIAVGAMTVPLKRGHEYLEVKYAPKIASNRLIQVPIAYYVHRVYKESNFLLLGMGGGP